jgi:hypothetical protein
VVSVVSGEVPEDAEVPVVFDIVELTSWQREAGETVEVL